MLFRVLDITFSLIGLALFSPVMIIITILGAFDTGSPFFLQYRLGRDKKPFLLFKFRTMRLNTISQPSHLADRDAITPLGRFLRKSKLDEMPQLFNVLIGDMSLVGPRPGLIDHGELTKVRDSLGVFRLRPGVTGLSQINGIDMSEPYKLAKMDAEMIGSFSVWFYLHCLVLTLLGRGRGDRIK